MSTILVLGPGCSECRQLKIDVEAAAARLGLAASIEHVTDIDRIIAIGVLLTPALVINDQVRWVGQHRSITEIEDVLRRYCSTEGGAP